MKTSELITQNQRVAIEQITPDWASAVLDEQEAKIAKGEYNQRRLNDNTVDKYAAEMKAGHWMLNNQGIGFDADGNLMDGRHRLWAVKKSGVTISSLVLRGIPSIQKNGIIIKAQDTIDCGRQRTLANQLQIDGVLNANQTAAAIKAMVTIAANQNVKTSVIQVRTILSKFERAITQTLGIISNNRLRRSGLTGPISLYYAVRPKKADEFARSYVEMVGLKQGSPVIALSKYFRSHPRGSGSDYLLGINACCLALMHFNDGTSINALRASTMGLEWIRKECKDEIAEIRRIAGA